MHEQVHLHLQEAAGPELDDTSAHAVIWWRRDSIDSNGAETIDVPSQQFVLISLCKKNQGQRRCQSVFYAQKTAAAGSMHRAEIQASDEEQHPHATPSGYFPEPQTESYAQGVEGRLSPWTAHQWCISPTPQPVSLTASGASPAVGPYNGLSADFASENRFMREFHDVISVVAHEHLDYIAALRSRDARLTVATCKTHLRTKSCHLAKGRQRNLRRHN